MTIDERSGKYAHEITENSTAGGKDHHLHHFDFCGSHLPVPFLWMVSTSFKETSEIYKMPPDLLPTNPTVQNYIEGWKGADFGLFFKNSLFITIIATVGTVLSSAFVAYGFARFKARFSGLLFTILLAT